MSRPIIIMGIKFRKQKITLAIQLMSLRQTYGDLIQNSGISNSRLTCVIKLQPSEDCAVYRVKIVYKLDDYSPKVWLLEPELQKIGGKQPHHIYGCDEEGHPQLCVYYPGYGEWNQRMLISHSFVPWVITWLNTYEYWLITGEWSYSEVSFGGKKR